MSTSTITSKGQTTIPSKVRDFLHLKAGDQVRFFMRENGDVVIRRLTDIRELKGILPKPKKPVSLEDMQKAIEEGAVERFLRSNS